MSTPISKIIRHVKIAGMTLCPQETLSEEKEENSYRQALQEGSRKGYEIGKKEGIEIGFKMGMEQAYADLQTSADTLRSISYSFHEAKENIFKLMKPELIRLCLAICESLLKNALSHPHILAKHIEELLNQIQSLGASKVKIFLVPEDLSMLEKNLDKINVSQKEFNIQFMPDPLMTRGNCRLETDLGWLHFDIKRLLTDIEKKIL